ncbi:MULTISPECIES: hypothetical protein [Streptomyces]|uniref:terpene synthase family protein n=1 Tax=Streptomyces TaxID=1883 RepID=UPI000A84135B|nr:hypothetical protein [Streptomyces virginiae]
MTARRADTTPWAKLAIADLFPARTSPPPDTGAQHAQDWMDHYRLCDQDPAARARLLGSRMGQCVARVHPQAGPEIRELATDLFLWLIAYDDIHVEALDATPTTFLPRIATFLGVLETGERTARTASTTGTGFTAALTDLAHRTRTVLPPGPAARLTAFLHVSFLSMLWDPTRRKTPVSLAEYLTMRPHSVLGRVSVTLVEPAAGLDLAARMGNDEAGRPATPSVGSPRPSCPCASTPRRSSRPSPASRAATAPPLPNVVPTPSGRDRPCSSRPGGRRRRSGRSIRFGGGAHRCAATRPAS